MDIKVGDIVRTKEKYGKAIIPAAVTRVYGDEESGIAVEVLFADGTNGYRGKGKYQETGRCVDIQSMLDAIK